MNFSYLITRFSAPIDVLQFEQVLEERFTGLSPAFAAAVRGDLDGFRKDSGEGHQYYPDAIWLEAHLDYLRGRTYREITLLAAQGEMAKYAALTDQACPWFSREIRSRSHIAFGWVEAGLAETIARNFCHTNPALFGLFQHQAWWLTGHKIFAEADRGAHPAVNWPSPYCMPGSDLPDYQEGLLARHASEAEQLQSDWQAFVEEQHAHAIRQASDKLLFPLGSSHVTNGTRVFYRDRINNEPIQLENCDPLTFREINHAYATDGRGLWAYGRNLPCEQPQAFRPAQLGDGGFTDGFRLYSDGFVIEDIDIRNIRRIGATHSDTSDAKGFLHEKEFLWRCGYDWYSNEVDAESFRSLQGDYFVDREHAYYLHEDELIVLKDFEPQSLRIIEHDRVCYLLDSRNVAMERGNGHQPLRLKGANPATFHGIADLPFVTDGKHVWLKGKRCPDLDAGSLRAPPRHAQMPTEHGYVGGTPYFISAGKVYSLYCDRVGHQIDLFGDADADAASFEILHIPLSRDAKHIWFNGRLLPQANPSTFEWIDPSYLFWTDGSVFYIHGKPMPSAWLEAARAGTLSIITRDLIAVGSRYYLDGIEIADTRQLRAACGCFCDDDFYYQYQDGSNKAILVWSKQITEKPVAVYTLNSDKTAWVPEDDSAEPLLFEDGQPVLSREEFDTLVESMPPGDDFDQITSSLQAPENQIIRMRTQAWGKKGRQSDKNYFIQIRTSPTDALHYQCSSITGTGKLEEIYDPVDTRPTRRRVRAALERFLNWAPPLSFATLLALEQRIATGQSSMQFETSDTLLTIQNGNDNLRGVWVDMRQAGNVAERAIVMVEDSGFLSTWFGTGPTEAFGEDIERFEETPWDLGRRQRFREHIARFLSETPIQQPLERKAEECKQVPDSNAAPRTEFARLLELLAPDCCAADRTKLLEKILAESRTEPGDACLAELLDTPEIRAWSALLDELEELGLLETFERDEPSSALATCQQLACAAAIKDHYELGDEALGDMLDVITDFNAWLMVRGYCLLWPLGAPRCDDEERYPAIIVARQHAAEAASLLVTVDSQFGLSETQDRFGWPL